MAPIYTKREWLPVAAEIAARANERASASGGSGATRMLRLKRLADLVIQVGPQATTHVGGSRAPAHYQEDTREIVVDSAVALPGVDPESVRWSDTRWRSRHLRAAGLVEHEIGHAVHTPMGALKDWHRAGAGVADFGRMLEEVRMEARVRESGGDRAALAAVARELILREWNGPGPDRFGESMRAALILGRSVSLGGCLSREDVEPFREAYRSILGADVVERLEGLLKGWNATRDDEVPDGAGMRERLKLWRDALGDEGEGQGEGQGEGEGEGEGEGQGEGQGEGEGEGEAGGSERASNAGDAGSEGEPGERGESLESGAGSGQGGGEPELGEAKPDVRSMLEDSMDDAARDAAAEARAAADAEDQDDAQEVERVSHGNSGSSRSSGGTREEPITTDARALAVQLAREFRRLQLPEVERVRRSSLLPPGRLHGRGAVLRDGQAAAGMVPDARPFRQARRSVTKAPPPVVGIMADVSGSMSGAAASVSTLAWAIAEAGRGVQARTALVTFGDRGRLVEHKPTVITRTVCDGGWENFRDGFRLLDKRLHLTAQAVGARVLFIVTDGAFVGHGEPEAAMSVTRYLERRGVAIVWAAIGCHWEGEAWLPGHLTGSLVQCPNPGAIGAAGVARVLVAEVERAMRSVSVTMGGVR